MICIVSGPSCSGKSTFVRSPMAARTSCLSPSVPVFYPARAYQTQTIPSGPCFFHYNILRPAALRRKRTGLTSHCTDFCADKAWRVVSHASRPKTAIVLVINKTTLRQRMVQRGRVGENFIFNIFNPRYKSTRWTELLDSVDLAALYAAWFDELRDLGINATILDASNPSYRKMDVNTLDLSTLNA